MKLHLRFIINDGSVYFDARDIQLMLLEVRNEYPNDPDIRKAFAITARAVKVAEQESV